MQYLKQALFISISLSCFSFNSFAKDSNLSVKKQNDANSYFAAGHMSLKGQFTPKNYSKAKEMLTEAANLGHPYAQYDLGIMYF